LAQIEQVGDSRILWRRQEFATLLKVVEDSRDAEHLTTSFELIQSVRWPFHTGRFHMNQCDTSICGCDAGQP